MIAAEGIKDSVSQNMIQNAERKFAVLIKRKRKLWLKNYKNIP